MLVVYSKLIVLMPKQHIYLKMLKYIFKEV